MARSRHGLVCCPKCASRDIAVRQQRGVFDFVAELCGSYRFRCRHCRYTFRGNPLRLTDLFFAKCPRCLNQALVDARPELEDTGAWMQLRTSLGASKYYCENCGAILASFRPVRDRKRPPEPKLIHRLSSDRDAPELPPMSLQQAVRQAWTWALEARRVVVRLRIRLRPRHAAAAEDQPTDRP
ncbi:MAG: hypothetical protein J0H49_30995 [Acidobacteria bacterium]|nr:hypothetical protein [Acidobacteriota bacterium]